MAIRLRASSGRLRSSSWRLDTQTSVSADHLTLSDLRALVEATAHVDGSALVFGSHDDDRLTYLPGNDDQTLARLVISTTPSHWCCEESGCRKDAAGRYEYRLLCGEHLAAARKVRESIVGAAPKDEPQVES